MSLPTLYRAGFVTLVGKPNVGKSTLMNHILKTNLSIVTPKAQTTRRTIRGIYHDPCFQMIFNDTPGILEPAYPLQKFMLDNLQSALVGTDVIVWLVDIYEKEVPPLIEQIKAHGNLPIILVLNKIDLLKDQAELETLVKYWESKVPLKKVLPIAALHNFHLVSLVKTLVDYLPQHPPYYPEDMLTDKEERFLAAEMIREQILNYYHQEVPYAVEVAITSFKESEKIIAIDAIIYVERKSQKSILIGKNGKALKNVGTKARYKLASFLEKPVFLTQHVKVLTNWRKENKLLKRLGYC